MSDDISPAEWVTHNAFYEKGWSLIAGMCIVESALPRGPGMFARRKLQKAIKCFQGALEIDPTGWQCMWALGKIHQRLGSAAESLFWFKKAIALAPDEPDVARETGLAAFDVGDNELGLQCAHAALDARPDDPGLMANLALAHLLGGDVAAAQGFVKTSLELAPDDPITGYVAEVIREVADGTRPQPASIHDIN